MSDKKEPEEQIEQVNPATQADDPNLADTDHTRTIMDYILIIRERWFIALIFAAAVTAYYASDKLKATPLYASRAIILFEIDTDRVVNIQGVVSSSIGRSMEISLRNHLARLKSFKFQKRVAQSLTEDERDLVTQDYVNEETGNTPRALPIIVGSNRIVRAGGLIFNFEFHHRNPEAAALLSNRFVEEYKEYLLERQREGNNDAIRFLRAESEDLRLKIEHGELEVQKFRQEQNLVSLEESQNIIVSRMKELNGSLNREKYLILELKTLIEQVDAAIANGDALTSLPVIKAYGQVSKYIADLDGLKFQRQSQSLVYGPKWPTMIANQEAINNLQKNLDLEVELAVNDLRRRLKDQQKKANNIETEFKKAEQESLELDQTAIEYNVLRRKPELDRALFAQITQRLNETLIASKLMDTDISVIDDAAQPGAPFSPNRKQIISTATVVFIISFIALPIGLAFLNTRVKTRSDVEHFIGKEFLGEVHKIKKKKGVNLGKVVLEDSDTRTSEFFRMLYSHIVLRDPNQSAKVFIVTSMSPQEGKSFTASNLAATFSKHERKTLIIDCDLRKPSMHKCLGLKNEAGVLTWYDNEATLDESGVEELKIQKITNNLDVIRAGGSTRAATEVISSERFTALINHFKKLYDVVLIDTPPSAVFSDAMLLGRFVDYYIFVCKQKLHDRRKIKAVVKRLDQTRGKVLGIIFNQTNPSKYSQYGGYYYQYGYYGDYYYSASDRDKKAQAKEESKNKKKKPPAVNDKAAKEKVDSGKTLV